MLLLVSFLHGLYHKIIRGKIIVMGTKIKDRYRLYIDESGDHNVNGSKKPQDIYLGVTGIMIQDSVSNKDLHIEMEAIKTELFDQKPGNPVIFHRDEIIGKKGIYAKLWDPELREEFDNRLLSLLDNQRYIIISTVLNKTNHKERYQDRAINPYNYCLDLLIERYCGLLRYLGAVGDVLAESRGKRENRLLEQEYAELYQFGTHYCDFCVVQSTLTSSQIKIKDKSENIDGLQLADILAYPCKQDILIESKIIPDDRTKYEDQISGVISSKYNKNYFSGRVWGYGKKIID